MISEKLAKIISYIFHPLLMPVLGLLMIFFSGTYLSFIPFEGKKYLFFIILSGTFIIPLSFIPFFYYFKLVKNIEIETSEQRTFPLLLTTILYFITFYIMHKFPVPYINMFILASATCVLLNLVINFKWKISSHSIGAGGLTGLALSLFLRFHADITSLLILALIISGLVGFARLRLNSHTPAQVYLGFIVGLITIIGITLA
jgi:membrane-associated phospholipid phosphatase